MSIFADVTLTVEVKDAAALIRAAREWLVEVEVAGDMETAAEICDDDDIAMALRLLICPRIPGISVQNSKAEIMDTQP